jgi:UDP-arabinose 4-epimerase
LSLGNVLVVGGAGYVGAHSCKSLSRAGFSPVVFDNLSTGHENFVQWGPLVRGDIGDAQAVLQAIQMHRVKAVLHFAASAYVGESVTDPQKYYENNVAGTLTLLNAMREADCRNLIFSSSCAVYGEPAQQPICETTPRNPVNPYGRSKLMVEMIAQDYERAYGLKSIILRYFNASGADPAGQLGELRDPETHLIPRAMMAIQGYLTDFSVFGCDYATHDGSPIRDYIHVSDIADAHVVALQRLLASGAGGAFNLGTGRGYSVKQVLDAIALETGEELKVVKGPRRSGDPSMLVADPSLAKRDLNFEPRLSDLKTVVATAWSWHRRAHPKRRDVPILEGSG